VLQHGKKNDIFFLISVVAFVSALVYVSADGLTILFRQWMRMEEYWRFLILPVSLYFVWNSRKEIASLLIKPNFFIGIPLVLASCALYVAWHTMFVDFFIETGLFLLVLGSIALVFGLHCTRVFLFPLLYLVLMTSIIALLLMPITEYMQHLSAIMSAWFLNISGWTVLREGRFIRLPHMVLEVARACSGTGQLTALIAFALPLGILMHRSLVSRLTLVGLTIPIALLVNTLRIILIAIWNYESPQAAIHGPYGILRTPIIHPMALLMVFLCSLALSWLEKKYKARPMTSIPALGVEKAVSPTRIRAACLTGFFCIGLAISGAWVLKTGTTEFIHELKDFPFQFAGYSGSNTSESDISFYMGKPDAVLERKYRTTSGADILLYICRFNRQDVGKRISSIESELFGDKNRTVVLSAGPATQFTVKTSHSDVKEHHFTTMSWFDVCGSEVSSKNAVRKKLARNALVPGPKRNNVALVVLCVDSQDTKAGLDLLSEFAVMVYPDIRRILETQK
jgi:exosortase